MSARSSLEVREHEGGKLQPALAETMFFRSGKLTNHSLDHAYVAPPFSQRGGSPYLIVRIVDLPPTPPGGIPKAKVAYYLRRRDVTNRSLADHRVIFATFMDGLVPLSHIRQKVQVMYRDYLEDPEAFKRQPDSFVFNQVGPFLDSLALLLAVLVKSK